MQVSELADRSGVPLATVKYYLREGLLPPGELVAPRRSAYDESHLRRLRVLRLLREIGGVPVTSLRAVMDALDDETMSIHEVMSLTADVISAGPEPGAQDADSLAIVDAVIAGLGWDRLRHESVDRLRLAALVRMLNGPGPLAAGVEVLTYYARLADELARTEISLIDPTRDRVEQIEDMVTGSVVYGQVFGLLRQMGHEHHHAVVSDHVAADPGTAGPSPA